MRLVMVFVTGLAIGLAVNTGFAQSDRLPGVNNMNHVAIAVDNFEEAFTFYTKMDGFVKGSPSRTIRGSPRWPVQPSRDTFIEIVPANANRRAGLNHFGLHVADLKSYVAALKQRGVTVEEPRQGRGDSMVANATDPGSLRSGSSSSALTLSRVRPSPAGSSGEGRRLVAVFVSGLSLAVWALVWRRPVGRGYRRDDAPVHPVQALDRRSRVKPHRLADRGHASSWRSRGVDRLHRVCDARRNRQARCRVSTSRRRPGHSMPRPVKAACARFQET